MNQTTNVRDILEKRAQIIHTIRDFFAARNILEVSTQYLNHHTVTEPNIDSISCTLQHSLPNTLYLHTSPEYAMKRLLASGSGSIFQICHAFRDDPIGSLHNYEFTMLEWYVMEYDYHRLMQQVKELLLLLFGDVTVLTISYRDIFYQYVGIDPFVASIQEKKTLLSRTIDVVGMLDSDIDSAIMSLVIEPMLVDKPVVMVYDYPASQSSLAKLSPHDPNVAERFEVFLYGVEVANGFTELTCPKEQLKRFQYDNKIRQQRGKDIIAIDQELITSLEKGIACCAGVAFGLDRVLMQLIGCTFAHILPR